MEYLIDTHVALWWWANDKQLSKKARKLLSSDKTTIYFSAISACEILIKHRRGKLKLPTALVEQLTTEVRAEGWIERSVNLAATVKAAQFEADHRDPFDRILAAQSLTSNIPVVSIDGAMDSFGVQRVW